MIVVTTIDASYGYTHTFPMTEDLIRTGEASRAVGCSVAQLHRWAADGTLPHKRVAGYLLFRRSDLDKFIASRTADSRNSHNKSARTCDGTYRHHGDRIVGVVKDSKER